MILQDQAPIVNLMISKTVAAQSSRLDGITLLPDWAATKFDTAHFTQ